MPHAPFSDTHTRGVKQVGPAADNLITRASSGDSDTGPEASPHVLPIFFFKKNLVIYLMILQV